MLFSLRFFFFPLVFHLSGNFDYKYFSSKVTQSVAQAACQNLNSNLASVLDDTENTFISDFVFTETASRRINQVGRYFRHICCLHFFFLPILSTCPTRFITTSLPPFTFQLWLGGMYSLNPHSVSANFYWLDGRLSKSGFTYPYLSGEPNDNGDCLQMQVCSCLKHAMGLLPSVPLDSATTVLLHLLVFIFSCPD